MSENNRITFGYINVVDESVHKGELTSELVKLHTENFSKPVLFKKMVKVDPKLATRAFYDAVEPEKTLQWRVKDGDAAVSMRSKEGKSDYNYVTGKVGTATEFLNDVFEKKLDVYSHLGTISSGYDDPYEWGKVLFGRIKDEIFQSNWCKIDAWRMTGHMFFGNSNQKFGEPARGAVGSDWHMFPTLNIFVMIAGQKRWFTRPPELGEQFSGFSKMFSTSSGREGAGETFEHDLVHLQPGDVLLNMPFEWHKVLNDTGLSVGAAFRVIDTDYIGRLAERSTLDVSKVDVINNPEETEELAHFLTSMNYASRHINRAQMILNDIEYAYLRRKGGSGSVKVENI